MARTLNPKITPDLRDKMITFFDTKCKAIEATGTSLMLAVQGADDATASKFGFRIKDLFV